MSELDALLARSRSPGSFVARKRFSLARHKAIEKMREFSLRHPQQYILELIQAAVFGGATWIAVDARKDSVLVGWVGGTQLLPEQLENLFDYLFIDQTDLDRRHLMQLAVGLNAIYQRDPGTVRIESGDGSPSGTVRMDMGRDGAIAVGAPEASLGGTYVHVTFRSSWLQRFFQTSRRSESLLVEERCLYTPIPILLNGTAPFGYRASTRIPLFGVTHMEHIKEEACRASLGLVRKGVRPEFRLVVGGVWVSTAEMPELGPELGGVIEGYRLRKTADMSDIVRDDRWIDLLHQLQPHATELIREHRGRRYKPPKLPARTRRAPGNTASAAAPDLNPPTPVEGPIDQCGPRLDLDLEHLRAMPPGSPVFWVAADASLEAAADPWLFPWRVLRLDQGQARWLAEAVPTIALSRMATAADFGFVRRILQRGMRSIETRVPLAGDLGPGTLTMTLHLEGPQPWWGRGEGLATLVRRGDTTLRTLRLPAQIGPISAVVDLERSDDPSEAGGPWRSALTEQVLAEAWRLLEQADDEPATRALRVAVLALHCRPTFVQEGEQIGLDCLLPSSLGSIRSQLRKAPLAEGREGPITLQTLLDTLERSELLIMAEESSRAVLEPLEEVLGFGRVISAHESRFPIAGVGKQHRTWRSIGPSMKTAPRLLFGVRDDLSTPEPDEGWHLLHRMAPVEVWARTPDAEVDLREGAQHLLAHLREERLSWEESPVDARTRDMIRLAILRLCTFLEQVPSVPDTTGSMVPLDQANLRIAPVRGPRVDEAGIALLTFDELRSAFANLPTPALRFDDSPEVFDSLAIEDRGWLLRQEVRVPGVSGWIGLRAPWDPTSAVFVETSRHMMSLGEVERVAPCHGRLWAWSTPGELTHAQVELLRASAMQLYRSLWEQMREARDAEWMQAARHYAAVFAIRCAMREGQLPRGLPRDLASIITVTDANGVAWGSLERWLESNEDQRPALPSEWASIAVSGPTAEVMARDTSILEQLSERVSMALEPFFGTVEVAWGRYPKTALDRHVRVRRMPGNVPRIEVQLHEDSFLARRCHEDRTCFEVLALEICRLATARLDGKSLFTDVSMAVLAGDSRY